MHHLIKHHHQTRKIRKKIIKMNKKINYNDIVINMLQIIKILQSFIIYLCFA